MRLSRSTGAARHHTFHELPDLLRPGDLLVLNRSRVIPARLLGRRASGGEVEALLVRQVAGDLWEALLRPSHRLRTGEKIAIAPTLTLQVEGGVVAGDGRRRVRLLGDQRDSLLLLQRHGHVPLPPYIARSDGALDEERYQTVFAREPGSVAAPTAGLHFTQDLFGRLAERGIQRAEIVLHVGPGTFLPVRVDDVEQHHLPPESYSIPEDTASAIARTRQRGGRIVAVGTTTTRALESAGADGAAVPPGDGETALVVYPGYGFRVVDALITNFHLPRSSLLLLVSAFAGTANILAAYREAVAAGYRFYSYGDAMLIDDWDDR